MTGVFLLVVSLLLLVISPPAQPDAHSVPFVTVLVQGAGAAAAVAATGGRSLAALPIIDGLLARVPAAEADRLDDRPGVKAVTDADRPLKVRELSPGSAAEPAARPFPAVPDPLGGESSPPNPPNGSAAAGQGVGVGVLDTGIAANGDLAGRVVASADLSGEWTFSDSYGHGSFMAGLIAGGGQGGGPAGVAPGADLVDLKVAGADGATTLGQVLAAMQLADAGRDRFNLRVLNVSLGAPADDPATAPLTEAAERLWADGITVVAAAGNDGGGVDAPGLDPYLLTVGAVDAAGQVPAWSSRGPDFAGRAKPDLVAPGVGLVGLRAPGSTIDLANPGARVGDRYFRGSGSSMSTAVVAGAAAVVAAAHPDWGPDRIKATLTGTADPLGAPAPAGSGAGALDLGAALTGITGAANGDLFPLRTVGRSDAPADPPPIGEAGAAPPDPPADLDGLGWRAGSDGRLRWVPAAGVPGPTAGAGDPEAWTAQPWLGGGWTTDTVSSRSWAAQQWLARVWAARKWATAGLQPAGWAALQWSWGGVLAATLDGNTTGGAVDWAARSWAARSWAERAWGPGDLAARSWAARSWAALAWEARSWAARSWAGTDWSARSWASRRWTAGSWAARSWARTGREGG